MLYTARENGQGLVEYALIIAFIAVLIILALSWVTGGLNSIFSRIAVYL
jgi:Flp pilus assembly pilin Flp